MPILDDSFLTPWLLDQIRDGNALLFLGAGASQGAAGRKGETAMNAERLRDLLSDTFLGGQLKHRSLAEVAEYAKNESSLLDVQRVVYDALEPLMPAAFHHILPRFRWHAIVTTNYDYIVERTYTDTPDALQNPVKIIKDGDAPKDYLGNTQKVPYLKFTAAFP